MQAYVLIKCNTGSETRIISELREMSEIVEINGIWGKYDIFLKIESNELQKIDSFVNRLRNHPDINETWTMHVLYGQGGSIDQANDS